MTYTECATYLVTSCAAHGTKEVADYASFVTYVEFCLSERLMVALGVDLNAGLEEGVSPWTCCDHMVIDPYGVLDH